MKLHHYFFLFVSLLSVSCTAPLHTVMPVETSMIEEAGGHSLSASSGTNFYFTAFQAGGNYSYALPYGVRLNANSSIFHSYSNSIIPLTKRNMFQYMFGGGLGFYKKLANRVPWQTNINYSVLNGNYSITKDMLLPPFVAEYSASVLSVVSAVRLRSHSNNVFELTLGYQHINLGGLAITSSSVDQSFIAEYNSISTYNRPTFGFRHGINFSNNALTIFMVVAPPLNPATRKEDYYNNYLIGGNFTILIK